MRKIIIYFSIICIFYNCKVHTESSNHIPIQYYKAYDSISHFMKKDKFLNDMKAKYGNHFIKFYLMKDIYSVKDGRFNQKNLYKENGLKEFSKKYSEGNLNKYKDIRQALPKDLKKYKGPNLFVYFSNIENDTLKVDILTNPYSEYNKTGSVDKFLIIFDKESIKIFNHWKDHYEW